VWDAIDDTPEQAEDMKLRSAPTRVKLAELSRHPLVVTFVGFVFTGILGAYLTWLLNYRDHMHEKEMSVRDAAIAAVTDISELVNERRVRGKLVASSIQRKAPEAEVNARKTAYDEALVRWNIKMPGDLLRMRAGLQWSLARNGNYHDWSRLRYEKYMDALINADMLHHISDNEKSASFTPGLFKIMDECVTKAFDAYRMNSFAKNDESLATLNACRFPEVHARSVDCFGRIAEALYKVVNEIGDTIIPASDEPLVTACKPPDIGSTSENCCKARSQQLQPIAPLLLFPINPGLFKWQFGLNAMKLNSVNSLRQPAN
jgi:hypothetical protein